MKKIFTAFISCSLLCFFSCASKNSVVPPVNSENNLESETESTESTELTEASQTAEKSDEEIESSDNSDDIKNDAEESSILISQMYPELEEIIEPEIETLEWTENEQKTEIESNIKNIEPVVVELPQAEEKAQTPQITSENPDEQKNSEKSELEIEKENVEISIIDVTNDDASAISEDEQKAEEEEIIPSRKVTLKKLEYLEISYPGKGWVFMGLTDGSKDLTFFGRKLGTENTKFTLQAKVPGTKILHFYKNDSVKKQYIDDYIEVEILNEKGSNTSHVDAPPYKTAVPKKAKKIIEQKKAELVKEEPLDFSQETVTPQDTIEKKEPVSVKKAEASKQTAPDTPSAPTAPVIQQKESIKQEQKTAEIKEATSNQEESKVPQIKDSKTLLQEAQLLYNEKEYKAAKEKIDQFFEIADKNQDEGLYLKGQILEAKSEVQNIKAAIESYTTLTKNYPASRYWDAANKRIIYLKRFYMEVR